ncbi:unnamed protein product [Cyclocybe aegerita]|uniref:RNA exonuclease 4 n=1 Tax=Cyclocybe aegerita TaxID=1973307 RepID=A0A8S0XMB6_CYCAE|nr:unnamed protein product [Cyclocybe aegerita]
MSPAKGKGKEKEKSLPSSNWLALQKKLQSGKKGSSSSKSASTHRQDDDRKRRKLGHDGRNESSVLRSFKSSSRPARTAPAEERVLHTDANNPGDDSRGSLQQMVLGHLEYTEHQKLPGKYLAIDCEMVGLGINGSESSLARVSLVNFYGYVVLDEFVRQKERVVDYRTQWSGIRERDLIGAKPFEEVQKRVAGLLDGRILIGHAVHHDLKALLLSHPWSLTRDTQLYTYKHGVTKQKRVALRNLVQQELKITIQSGEHSSVTDARATMAIYRMHKKEWEKGSRQLPLVTSSKATSSSSTTPSVSNPVASSGKRKEREVSESEDGSDDGAEDDAEDEAAEEEEVSSIKTSLKKTPHHKRVTFVSSTKSRQKAQKFPGGGRKGVSSGLSTVVRRIGGSGTTAKANSGKDVGTVSGGAVSVKEKAKSGWWKQLPGGATAKGGSKGSITCPGHILTHESSQNPDVTMKSNAQATINELIAGSVGGAAQVLVGQPLDTIKTRAQIAPKGMFKGPMDILKQTLRNEGFFALYKGMASPLLGIAGVNSLLFASYGISKRIISPYPQLSLKEIASAGAMAGAANAILASPVEMFKVRMQGQYGAATDKRLRAVFSEMWRDWGFRKGVMRGYWVTVAREIPAYAGFYTAFEFSKRSFSKTYGSDLPVWALLASGSTGGIAYWLSCYPLDVVKSRIQLRPTPPSGTPVQYIAHELKMIVQESGFVGLFRGLSPSLLRSIPAAASTFAAFELTREYLEKVTGV